MTHLKEETQKTVLDTGALGFENLLEVIGLDLQIPSLQDEEDCEYEYVGIIECITPYNDALLDVFFSLTPEQQEAFIELLGSYEARDPEALGEGLAEIVGEGGFCTDDFVAALPLLLTCALPSCINCERNGVLFEQASDLVSEQLNLIYGCGIDIGLCKEETAAPTYLPTSAPSFFPTGFPTIEETSAPVDEDNESSEEVEVEELSFYLSVAALFFALFAVIVALFALKKGSLKPGSRGEVKAKSKELL
eukprot:snap_masked-scaffold_21-processed-gene-5.74-mRNA-1 protein AED:1.00 eAED:1.00 QI:0/-1/0/0/-1/1/1/0/248